MNDHDERMAQLLADDLRAADPVLRQRLLRVHAKGLAEARARLVEAEGDVIASRRSIDLRLRALELFDPTERKRIWNN